MARNLPTEMVHLAEGLCLNALLIGWLPCGHMNTDSVCDGMTIYFTLENGNRVNRVVPYQMEQCSQLRHLQFLLFFYK